MDIASEIEDENSATSDPQISPEPQLSEGDESLTEIEGENSTTSDSQISIEPESDEEDGTR